jgi:Restriction endonuclease
LKDYHLHEIDPSTFELIVLKVSSKLLGIGVTGFSSGPDGGRDGKFSGTATAYPSTVSPWSGTWIIQAKHTESPISTCSDQKFLTSFETDEVPRIRKLVAAGEAENYILFTNRRKSGNAHAKLETISKAALGHDKVGIVGVEDISRYLDSLPDVVRQHIPSSHRGPLLFSPQELAALIVAFAAETSPYLTGSATDDFLYVPLASKNQLNNVSEQLADSITDDSEPYFAKIEEFLARPQNEALRLSYQALANELKQKLIAEDATRLGFATALADIYDIVTTRHPNLSHNRRLVTVFLHYMYATCDIGRKR